MTVWRKWVFPILKTLLVAAIAVALVKLAFFPDRADAEGAVPLPTGGLTEPTVQVVSGSISNEVVLTGTVNADAAVPVKATGAGAVDEVFVPQGATVRAGDKIFDIKVENPVEPVEQVGPDGMPSITTPRPTYRFEKVLAPADGVLSSLGVIPGQQVTIGEVAGQVAPPTFNVSATLTPEQQYRLTAQPTEAVVAISGGPAPFTCTGLTITTPISGAGGSGAGVGASGGADGGAGGVAGGASGGTAVQCRVPGDVRVFPGLSAQVKISAGSADAVLVVPITAVEGGADTGVVWLVAPDGERVERPVRLGLSDGTNVAVVEGVAEGDTVLQFVPGAPGEAGAEGCVQLPDGSVMCGTLAP